MLQPLALNCDDRTTILPEWSQWCSVYIAARSVDKYWEITDQIQLILIYKSAELEVIKIMVSPIFAGESDEVDDLVQDDIRSVHPGLVADGALWLLLAAVLAYQVTSSKEN